MRRYQGVFEATPSGRYSLAAKHDVPAGLEGAEGLSLRLKGGWERARGKPSG